MASLGDLVARLGLTGLTEFKAAMASIPQAMQQAASDAEKAWAPMQSIGTSLLGLGAGLSAAVTAPLVGLGAAAIKTGEQLNIAEMAFATMLGSAEKAQKFLAELQQFAAATPFEFPDLVEAAKRMQAMGFAAEQVVPTLRIIGDSVAALGGGKDVINGVTLALGQMQAKGKVSAQEMNQLAERGIPAWKFLADAIGKSIPEAMKLAESGAIKAAEAIPAILEGMQQKFGGQMAKMSATLTGTWSNFKDTLTMTLAEIGQTLTPILQQIVASAMPLLEWAKQAAQWFAALPDPIRNGAVAFGAMLAAIGPLALAIGGVTTAISTIMPVLAGLGAALGVGTAAVLGWAAAIPIAIAALVALGSWVSDNWEPIKAVVSQAWDGVKEAWGSVWGWAVPYITGAWDLISGSTTKAWDYIGGFLGKVWEGIKTSAQTIWGGIVSVFQTFLEWAAKIPGVNKLLNLDDAWKSAKKLQEQTEKTAKATQNLAKGAESSGKKLKTFAVSAEELAKQQKKAEAEARKLQKAAEDQEHAHVRNNQATRKFLDNLDEWQAKHRPAIEATKALNDAIAAMEAETVAAGAQLTVLADTVGVQLTEALRAPIDPITNLEAAYETLGIKSAASAQQHADKAKQAYEDIRASGTATAGDLDAAWVKYEEARIAAARAAGEQIPAETQAALDKVKEKLEGKPAKQPWSDWSKQVSTIVTDLGKEIGQILWDGDTSWAEKGKKILGEIGQAFTRSVVEPITKAAGDLIAGALSDLIGGKGFGGLLDRITGIGDAIAGVFGRGGVGGDISNIPAPNIPDVNTPAGGVPGVGGAAVGAGLNATLGTIFGGIGAAAGVASFIQGFQMEKGLDALEHEARYSQIHLSYILENSNTYWPYLEQMHKSILEFRGDIVWQIGEINDRSRLGLDHLGTIARDAKLAADRLLDGKTVSEQIRDAVREIKPTIVNNFNVSGAASPQATADAIALRLRTQVFS